MMDERNNMIVSDADGIIKTSQKLPNKVKIDSSSCRCTVERGVKGQFSCFSLPILINIVFYFPCFALMNGHYGVLKNV